MSVVGSIESLWRYPVKSMMGESLPQAYLGFSGVLGDRVYSIHNAAAPAGFPYLTAREQQRMLLYRATYRDAKAMAAPPNLAEAEAISPDITPVYPGAAASMVDVHTPAGETLAIDDPRLLADLGSGLNARSELSLARSDRSMTDCSPISLFSLQTARQLSQEFGSAIDKGRFRANLYLDLAAPAGFQEDAFVGRTLRIGSRATLSVLARDPRCKIITLDPATGDANPEVMKLVARSHEGKAGIYAAVLVEGLVHTGDDITLLN